MYFRTKSSKRCHPRKRKKPVRQFRRIATATAQPTKPRAITKRVRRLPSTMELLTPKAAQIPSTPRMRVIDAWLRNAGARAFIRLSVPPGRSLSAALSSYLSWSGRSRSARNHHLHPSPHQTEVRRRHRGQSGWAENLNRRPLWVYRKLARHGCSGGRGYSVPDSLSALFAAAPRDVVKEAAMA